MSGLDFEIEVGGKKVPGRLPIMQRRLLIAASYGDALREDADARTRGWRLGLSFAAALGVCWAGEPLKCPSLKACGWDVDEYGEGVLGALLELGVKLQDITSAGRDVAMTVCESIPTDEEVDDAAVPTAAPAVTSTGSTS